MKLVINCDKAQLVRATNGQVYVVTADGTTIIFRDEAAKQLGEKYCEQSSIQEWDFQVQLNVQVAQPVAYPKVSKDPHTDPIRELFLLVGSAVSGRA